MATNADAYVPSLVLADQVLSARKPLHATVGGQNIAGAVGEGFTIIGKKGDPRYSNPKRLFLTII